MRPLGEWRKCRECAHTHVDGNKDPCHECLTLDPYRKPHWTSREKVEGHATVIP